MIPDEDARATGAPNLVVLRSSCRRLNDQRIDLDRRIAVQRLEEDFGCYAVWQERQDVLEDLGAAAERLARVSATRLTEVRAKAEVLALLMRPNGGEPIVPQDKTRALTLSLTDDLAGLAATATRPRETGSPASGWRQTAADGVRRFALHQPQQTFRQWMPLKRDSSGPPRPQPRSDADTEYLMKDGKRGFSVSGRRQASPPPSADALPQSVGAGTNVPSKRPLFRQEVIEFQQHNRQWGRVVRSSHFRPS